MQISLMPLCGGGVNNSATTCAGFWPKAIFHFIRLLRRLSLFICVTQRHRKHTPTLEFWPANDLHWIATGTKHQTTTRHQYPTHHRYIVSLRPMPEGELIG